MNTTNHTPGPWYYSKGSAPAFQGQVYQEATGKTLALTYDDEQGMNAKLIAAAPDLLAALVAYMDHGSETEVNSMGLDCPTERACIAEDNARAAITKATE